ncbi:MAG TPA: argininosuccinate lyase [Gemmatimonadales bacterium]|nr:argininosuccinate lyase [Gemmatimonadales bacterium]
MTPRRSSPQTLWSSADDPDRLMLDYTVGEDRLWDMRLLPWDVYGSLGHVEGLRASKLLSASAHRKLRTVLRRALREVEDGVLVIDLVHEDAHSAVEDWITRRHGVAGEQLHTGRSRNDQVVCDLRLYLKNQLLELHEAAEDVAGALLDFAARHRDQLWPGYTHARKAMPSSIGLWAAAYAEGLLDTLESLPALWARVDRSPLGSAAGYGVPLPLDREATARALGFAAVEHNVAAVQLGRGKLEAAVLAWCGELGHDLARFSSDVILFSAEEYGYLVLPARLATGSSIMPHKRNPDLFELTRARAATVHGDHAALLHVASRLTGGDHRDFQLLKEPLFRGLQRTREMLSMLTVAIPSLGVNATRCAEAIVGDALATDEVMRRVEEGVPFRRAYRQVAAELKAGGRFPPPTRRQILARRRSMGGLGNLGLPAVRGRVRARRQWSRRERQRFERALRRLAGRGPERKL